MKNKKINKRNKKKDRTLEIVTHIIGIFSYILGALLIFLLTKEKEVKKHAQNALNWQISLFIYSGVTLFLSFISSILEGNFSDFTVIFPFSLILSLLSIFNIAFCIIAAVKANEGIFWEYPLTIDFLKKIKERGYFKQKKI
ncbi:DUF4870 domain-containing protein [Patescibacteria group bacterium]|nr:DUF4870 domain-containing protein [Patescibacteria group bacterium]